MVMMYTVSIRPYGENEEGDLITDFSEDDMEIIKDLFKSLGRKCVQEYDDIEEVSIEREVDLIVINYRVCGDEEIEEDDFLFYLETLTGHNSENIVSFDDENYSIKGSPIVTGGEKKVSFAPHRSSPPPPQEKVKGDDSDYYDKMFEVLNKF